MERAIDENELWRKLATSLTLYFIYGDIKDYNKFDKIFDKYFDYDCSDDKIKYMQKIVKMEDFCPVDYLLSEFNTFRKDYETEFKTVLNGCKYCYKLKE